MRRVGINPPFPQKAAPIPPTSGDGENLSPPSSEEGRPERARDGAGGRRFFSAPTATSLLALGLLFVGMSWISWRKWPDLLIDFGQYLYVPWRMTLGEGLGEDLANSFGPLTFHLITGLFKTFGVSFLTLALFNLTLAAIATGIIFQIHLTAFNRRTATLTAAVFLGVFCFAHYTGVGNYNWITPYNHESYYGALLVLGIIGLTDPAIRSSHRLPNVAIGLLFGLLLMTRLQAILPGIALIPLYLFMAMRDPVGKRRPFWRRLLDIVAGAAPPILFFFWFTGKFPLEYLRGNLGFLFAGAQLLAQTDVRPNPFYANVTGLGDIPGNLRLMARGALVCLGLLALAGLLSLRGFATAPRWIRFARRVVLLLLALVGTVAFQRFHPALSEAFSRPLPLFAAGLTANALWRAFFMDGHDAQSRRRNNAMALWGCWSLALLLKVPLNTKFAHYGFLHAMPATLLTTAYLTGRLPEAIARLRVDPALFRRLVSGVVLLFAAWHIWVSAAHYRRLTFPVGAGADQILTYAPELNDRGLHAEAFRRWAVDNIPEQASFQIIPEGVILNYLTRRRHGSRYFSYLYFNASFWGDEKNIRIHERGRPDFFVLVDRDTREYGLPPFGTTERYGKRMLEWIEAHYEPVALFGAPPFHGQGFGVQVYRIRPETFAEVDAAPSS